LPRKDVLALIRSGDVVAMKVRGQVLVVYGSLLAFTRREQAKQTDGGHMKRECVQPRSARV
jgi:hypothetical protein